MTIPDGYHDVPAGKIAAVVTYLEMREAVSGARVEMEGMTIRRMGVGDVELYRRVFRAVGEQWLWFSRLLWREEQLREQLGRAEVEAYVLEEGGEARGLLELNFGEFPDVEIDFFGLTAEMIGRGVGRGLMGYAVERAFGRGAKRLFLHTCTLDHPKALRFYQAAGFVAYKRMIEVADDPRVTGYLGRGVAPQIPVIE